MEEKSRLQNSFFNFASGIGYRILTLFTAFVVRTVFIRCLNAEYLGINGLYSNILSMLSLAELGFGTAIVYSMYEPLANKNYEKLQQLMRLYKKAYTVIGTVVLLLGLALVPFLDVLIKDKPNINGLTFYYILFLLNSVVSYWFFAYRNSLLEADQKAHVVTNYNSIFNLIKSVAQIVLLVIFHSFTIYLLIQIICTICQNIVVARKVDKLYPFMRIKSRRNLPRNEKKKIFKDVKALMLTKISHIALNSTDNIIISAFVGLKWVGLLSNFVMISDAITSILCQITSAITASLGNFFAKNDKKAGYGLFLKVEFLNFWLYGFCMIALIILLNPFINLWLGDTYMLSQGAIVWLSINFFVAGFMNTIFTFRSTLGLFTQGQYRPLIVTAINIGLSIGLSYRWGIVGVLAATSISRLCVNLWYDPWLVHKRGFGVSVKPFFVKYIKRCILLLGIVLGMKWISEIVFIGGITFINFIIMLIIVGIIPNMIFVFVFYKKEEFQYFVILVKKVCLKIKMKL